VRWTNSFAEISTLLERNAREHDASFVLFTGDVPLPSEGEIQDKVRELESKYGQGNVAD
jgi:hypothetical protein